MRHMFERAGDRILRLALPERKASACGWTAYKTIWSTSTTTLQQSVYTCNGSTRCRVSVGGGPYMSASCPS